MGVTIEGDSKEIAALVAKIQGRQNKKYYVTINATNVKDYQDILNLVHMCHQEHKTSTQEDGKGSSKSQEHEFSVSDKVDQRLPENQV